MAVTRALLVGIIMLCAGCLVSFDNDGVMDGNTEDTIDEDSRRLDSGSDTRDSTDSSVDQRVDQAPKDGGEGDQDALTDADAERDQLADGADSGPSDGNADTGDLGSDSGFVCSPGEFKGCEGRKLQRCAADGHAVETSECAPGFCSEERKRCVDCLDSSVPRCDAKGEDLIVCIDGAFRRKRCSFGCKDGSCCQDSDDDNVTTCEGDCNDNNGDVHPGQEDFFLEPYDVPGTKAQSYDYNCDDKEELLAEGILNCTKSCRSEGWIDVTVPPSCGERARFGICILIGGGDFGDPVCSSGVGLRVPQLCR